MTRRLRAVVATAALAGVACFGVPTGPEFPADGPPTAFELTVAGFGFGAHDVALRGDTLVVVRRPDFSATSARTSRLLPTRADWAAFWRAADSAGVRTWPRTCANTGVVDGGGFSLRIEWPGGRVEASGSNSYPRRNGQCNDSPERSPEYAAFLAAVARLVGMPYP